MSFRDLPFEFSLRYPSMRQSLKDGISPEFARMAEERDRELENFLAGASCDCAVLGIYANQFYPPGLSGGGPPTNSIVLSGGTNVTRYPIWDLAGAWPRLGNWTLQQDNTQIVCPDGAMYVLGGYLLCFDSSGSDTVEIQVTGGWNGPDQVSTVLPAGFPTGNRRFGFATPFNGAPLIPAVEMYAPSAATRTLTLGHMYMIIARLCGCTSGDFA